MTVSIVMDAISYAILASVRDKRRREGCIIVIRSEVENI